MDLRERPGEVARRHPWEVARSRFFRGLIAEHADLATTHRVLDIGAGDGWFAHELAPDLAAGAEIICWDVNYRSEDLAAPTGAGIARTTRRPDDAFRVVVVLDVLEHIADAEAFLAEQVVPAIDGIAVFSVPAHPRLFSDHDRMLEHHRRYRPAELLTMLGRHLDVIDTGSLFATLVPPRALAVGLERLGRPTDPSGVGTWSGGPALTRGLTAVLDADAAVARRLGRVGIRLPGLSAWAVTRRQRA